MNEHHLNQTPEECTCVPDVPGPCSERELATRRVRLGDSDVVDGDRTRGFVGMLRSAAHLWFELKFPDHDKAQCWEFEENSAVLFSHDGWRVLVFDLDGQLWQFHVTPFNPDDFPPDESGE